MSGVQQIQSRVLPCQSTGARSEADRNAAACEAGSTPMMQGAYSCDYSLAGWHLSVEHGDGVRAAVAAAAPDVPDPRVQRASGSSGVARPAEAAHPRRPSRVSCGTTGCSQCSFDTLDCSWCWLWLGHWTAGCGQVTHCSVGQSCARYRGLRSCFSRPCEPVQGGRPSGGC